MSRLAHQVSATAAPQAVYQSARVGSSFSYAVSSLTPGVPYTVRLHLAEIGSVTASPWKRSTCRLASATKRDRLREKEIDSA